MTLRLFMGQEVDERVNFRLSKLSGTGSRLVVLSFWIQDNREKLCMWTVRCSSESMLT